MRPDRSYIYIVAVLVMLNGCTDAGLQPAERPQAEPLDNLLTIKGEHCVQPDATIELPVKVLFIVDQSASLQCTDPTNRRFAALDDLIGNLLGSRANRVGVVGFSSWTRYTPFTGDGGAIRAALDPNAGGGTATDYQGALATAVRIIEQDIIDSEPGVTARTRYVVTFVSDGIPEPRCNAGCEDDGINCSDGLDNDGDGDLDDADSDCADIGDNVLHPDNLYGICNTTEDLSEIQSSENPNGPEYVDFTSICPAYNQPDQIMQRVSSLVALKDIYSVGDVVLHTVFLFTTEAFGADSLCASFLTEFAYDQEQARILLRAMASEGGGTFRDVNTATADDDNFLDFNYRMLETHQWKSSFVALDQHARLAQQGFEPDIDVDGLADNAEIQAGTDPKKRDSDGDRYSDLFELRMKDSGFDPLDPDSPAVPCPEDSGDPDGDGLLDCEETFLQTDLRLTDTDGDGLLDWLELVNGTDPVLEDGLEDVDFDGIFNADEITGGTDPLTPDADRYRDSRIHYQLTDLGVLEVPDRGSNTTRRRQCSEFEVRNIQLVTTPWARDIVPEVGLNRILIYAQEQPAQLSGARSETFVACFEVFYRSPTSKDPENGIIDVSPAAWEETLLGIQERIDGLLRCNWFDPADFRRARIREVIEQCLPEGIQLGKFEFSREEVVSLLRHYVADNNAVNLPYPPSQLFVHIENFNPNRDCYRPWEVEYLNELFRHIRQACKTCTGDEDRADYVPPDESDGDGLDADGDSDADTDGPNRCCYTMAP